MESDPFKLCRQKSAHVFSINVMVFVLLIPWHQFPQFNPQSIEPLTLICCQRSHGLVLKEPPVRPVPLQRCWERQSTTHRSMRSLLSPRSLLFPLFCHSKTEKQRKSSKRDRQTEREWREKRRRQKGRDVKITDIIFIHLFNYLF